MSAVTFAQPRSDDTEQRLLWKIAGLLEPGVGISQLQLQGAGASPVVSSGPAFLFSWSPTTTVCTWVDSAGIHSTDYPGFVAAADRLTVTSLDFSAVNTLQVLNNLFDLPGLTFLDATGQQLTTVDLTGCGSLVTFSCALNPITSLDLSPCSSLSAAYCYQCNLTSLTVGTMLSLTDLRCQQNAIPSLNVAGSVNLAQLRCYSNQLGALNITGCVGITTLWTYNNPSLVVTGP